MPNPVLVPVALTILAAGAFLLNEMHQGALGELLGLERHPGGGREPACAAEGATATMHASLHAKADAPACDAREGNVTA